MNKSNQAQVNRALSLASVDSRYAAVSLATIQRSANSRTAKEVADAIEANPSIKRHLALVNGCYVEAA